RHRGLLFLGSSESVPPGNPDFEAVDLRHCIYRAKPPRTFRPIPYLNGSTFVRAWQQSAARPVDIPGIWRALPESKEEEFTSEDSALATLHLSLIERFAEATAVVNSRFQLVHASEKMSSFLRLSGPIVTELPRLVHRSLRVP